MSDRFALILANSEFDDPRLTRLRTPGRDAEALAEVLDDPAVGGFDVTLLVDETEPIVRAGIARFYHRRKSGDLLLLYYSGHGIRDKYSGRLYLATRNTEIELVSATALDAAFLNEQIDQSNSRRKVVVLDCCHSGAFAEAKTALGSSAGAQEAFVGNGYGRAILTASNALEIAWEGDKRVGEAETSVFTHYLVKGLQTGAADVDNDGQVSLDELYEYVYDQVVENSNQTPQKSVLKVEGQIIIARNPHRVIKPADLPPNLQQAIDSDLPWMREGAVRGLERLLRGSDEGLALAARRALERLADDDSRAVSAAAAQTLGASPKPLKPEPSPVPSRPFVVEEPELSRVRWLRRRPLLPSGKPIPWQWAAGAGLAVLALIAVVYLLIRGGGENGKPDLRPTDTSAIAAVLDQTATHEATQATARAERATQTALAAVNQGTFEAATNTATWLSQDDDGDGLVNSRELELGTLPDKRDTDDDGLADGVEVDEWQTDPLNDDHDSDGLTDGEEVAQGLNPKSSDTDGDGMSDDTDPEPLKPTQTRTKTPTPAYTPSPFEVTFLGKWGSEGDGDGQFLRPWGIGVVWGHGDVYVADNFQLSIQHFSSSGRFLGRLSTQAGHFIAVDSEGFIYATNYDPGTGRNERVEILNYGQGDLIESFRLKEGSSARGIAVDKFGQNIYVTDLSGGRVQRYSPDGQLIAEWGLSSGNGKFYAWGIAVDRYNTGRVYVAETGTDRIQVFSADGEFLKEWGVNGTGDGQFDSPIDVAVDTSGNVYVLDSGNARVQVFSPEGEFLGKWGKVGRNDGEFLDPYGITVDGNENVYVLDSGNYRVQVFRVSLTP